MKKILALILLTICLTGNAQQFSVQNYLSTDSIHYRVIPARCSAHITTGAATTITDANTYYFLKGAFHNDNISQFTASGDTLVYSNGNGRYLFITYDFTVTAANNNETVTIGIHRNNTLIDGSNQSALCRTAGQDYLISGNFITQISNGDKLKIMVKSDNAGSTVTATLGSITAIQIP